MGAGHSMLFSLKGWHTSMPITILHWPLLASCFQKIAPSNWSWPFIGAQYALENVKTTAVQMPCHVEWVDGIGVTVNLLEYTRLLVWHTGDHCAYSQFSRRSEYQKVRRCCFNLAITTFLIFCQTRWLLIKATFDCALSLKVRLSRRTVIDCANIPHHCSYVCTSSFWTMWDHKCSAINFFTNFIVPRYGIERTKH